MVIDADFVFKFLSVSIVVVAGLTAIYVRLMVLTTRVSTRQTSHEKSCEERNAKLDTDMAVIQSDIKTLISLSGPSGG